MSQAELSEGGEAELGEGGQVGGEVVDSVWAKASRMGRPKAAAGR